MQMVIVDGVLVSFPCIERSSVRSGWKHFWNTAGGCFATLIHSIPVYNNSHIELAVSKFELVRKTVVPIR